jgi:glycosyltransferase involved in cell wall biosynthesis
MILNQTNLPRVWGCNHGRAQWACQHYRIEVPLEGFARAKYATCWNDTLKYGFDASMKAMIHSDYDLFWGVYGKEIFDQLRILRDMQPAKDDEGEWRIPPVLIFDTDDNRDYIHPHSSVFVRDGVRAYPSTNLLTPGSTLWSVDEETGEKHILWKDGVTEDYGTVFDIARNLREMRVAHDIYRLVDGVTVVSPHHARYMREVIGVKNVHVFPNTILPDHYQSYPLVPRGDGKVRILWQGGASHVIDWYPLRHAVRAITERHPEVTWVIFGQLDDWVAQYIPSDRVEHHQWVEYAAYKLKRSLLQIDINLCPLADNLFNRCKSAIKWYEASVWDKPEATLAANVPPFSDEMVNDETGLLYDSPEDFVEKLSALITDADLRARLGQAAKTWVLTHRTPSATIPDLWSYYVSLRERRIGEHLLSQGAGWSQVKRLAAEQGLTR